MTSSWFERQRGFLDYSLSCLWRRKGRNLSLIAVYAFVVFLISSVIFFTDALRREMENVLEEAPEMIVQRTVGGRHALIPVDYAEKMDAIRGVRSAEPRLWGYYFHLAAGSNYTLMVPEEFSLPEDQVKVGTGVLRTWGTIEEGRLYFRSRTGEPLILGVGETFEGDTELMTADLILMAEGPFRRIAGIPEGYAADIALRIRNPRECQVIAEKISYDFPDTRPILKEEIQRTYTSLFGWRSGYVVVLLAGALAAFLIFTWDKATGLSAEEKAEIGILKGVGWDTSDILLMKFWEGAAISLTAFVLGVLAAYVHVFLASAALFEHALKGWAVLYPSFELRPTVDGFRLAVLLFLSVIPYTLVTIVPVWRTAVTDPDTVMRQG